MQNKKTGNKGSNYLKRIRKQIITEIKKEWKPLLRSLLGKAVIGFIYKIVTHFF